MTITATITHQLLERRMDGLLLPQVAVIEGDLLAEHENSS